jgi:hypothetical protein
MGIWDIFFVSPQSCFIYADFDEYGLFVYLRRYFSRGFPCAIFPKKT